MFKNFKWSVGNCENFITLIGSGKLRLLKKNILCMKNNWRFVGEVGLKFGRFEKVFLNGGSY